MIILFDMTTDYIGGQLLFVQVGDLEYQAEVSVLLPPIQPGELTAHLNIVRSTIRQDAVE